MIIFSRIFLLRNQKSFFFFFLTPNILRQCFNKQAYISKSVYGLTIPPAFLVLGNHVRIPETIVSQQWFSPILPSNP